MSGAYEALVGAAVAAVRGVPGIGAVYAETPRRAALPHVVVDGIESDWGHKSGDGRELRLAVTLRDGGESAARVRGLADAADVALRGIGPELNEWRVASLAFLRRRTVPDRQGWAVVVEYRARLLKEVNVPSPSQA